MVHRKVVSYNIPRVAIGAPASTMRNNVFSLAKPRDHTQRQRPNNVNDGQAYKNSFAPNYTQYKKANTSQVEHPNQIVEQRTPSELGRTLENIGQITSGALLNAGIFASVVQPELLPVGIATSVAGAGIGLLAPAIPKVVEAVEKII